MGRKTMTRLERKFRELKKEKRCAFIAYITAGDPDLAVTRELIFELERQGVDVIELGVPFSDPLADGPVIQAASLRALKGGTTLIKIIHLVKAVRSKVAIPLCLMSYYNSLYKFGLSEFARQADQAGIDGLIVPDLPPEEAGEFIRYARQMRLDTIFFVSPTSKIKRIKLAAAASSGFIYYVSLTGTTGARSRLPLDFKKKISLISKYTRKPVCVGFGLSKPEHIKEISRFCQGVIVGSAIVRQIARNLNNKNLVKKVGCFVRSLTREL